MFKIFANVGVWDKLYTAANATPRLEAFGLPNDWRDGPIGDFSVRTIASAADPEKWGARRRYLVLATEDPHLLEPIARELRGSVGREMDEIVAAESLNAVNPQCRLFLDACRRIESKFTPKLGDAPAVMAPRLQESPTPVTEAEKGQRSPRPASGQRQQEQDAACSPVCNRRCRIAQLAAILCLLLVVGQWTWLYIRLGPGKLSLARQVEQVGSNVLALSAHQAIPDGRITDIHAKVVEIRTNQQILETAISEVESNVLVIRANLPLRAGTNSSTPGSD